MAALQGVAENIVGQVFDRPGELGLAVPVGTDDGVLFHISLCYSKMTSVLVSKSWSHQAMWSMIFLREERERAHARVLPSSVVI